MDIILRSSTISADTVTIVDPSSPQYRKSNGVADTPDGTVRSHTNCESQLDNNDRVVVSINNQDVTDSNDNVAADKLATTAEVNGHTESEKNNPVELSTTKKKKKDKAKKTCQII